MYIYIYIIFTWERAINVEWDSVMKRSQTYGGYSRSALCAFCPGLCWPCLAAAIDFGICLAIGQLRIHPPAKQTYVTGRRSRLSMAVRGAECWRIWTKKVKPLSVQIQF